MGARKVLEEVLPVDESQSSTNGVNGASAGKEKVTDEQQQLPEIWAYLGVLVQVC